MTQEELANVIASLPPTAKKEAFDFIESLKQRYQDNPSQNQDDFPDIETEPFIGMWKDRTDMCDGDSVVEPSPVQETKRTVKEVVESMNKKRQACSLGTIDWKELRDEGRR